MIERTRFESLKRFRSSAVSHSIQKMSRALSIEYPTRALVYWILQPTESRMEARNHSEVPGPNMVRVSGGPGLQSVGMLKGDLGT